MICMKKLSLLILSALFLAPTVSWGQQVGIKTDLVSDAFQSPNLGAEFSLSNRFTLEASTRYNPFGQNSVNKKMHWFLRPEFRWWMKEAFDGHFFGLYASYGIYNVAGMKQPLGPKDRRYEGDAYGVGLTYGYQWKLARRWRLETSLSAGYIRTSYDYYDCRICGERLGSDTKHFFRPTRAAISIVYLIGKTKKKKALDVPAELPVTTDTLAKRELSEAEREAMKQAIKQEVLEELKNEQPKVDSLPNHQCVGELLEDKYVFLIRDNQLEPGDTPVATPRKSTAILFRQGSSEIEPMLGNNLRVLEELSAVVSSIKKSTDTRITKIEVAGYASPEGMLYNNVRIAGNRASELGRYLTNYLGIPTDRVVMHNGGEDWDGLRRLVETSNLPWKQQALQIIDNVPIMKGREKQLMDLQGGNPYRYMYRYFFPQLRNAAYIKVYYEELNITQ
ncbi:DUF3575 domain-containing protein [Bacteroides sp.]